MSAPKNIRLSENRVIPDNVKPYAKSPLFNSKTVPDKLLQHHNLKEGTWGLLNVCQGSISFYVDNDGIPQSVLYSGDKYVILPVEFHYINISDDAEFYIEFYK